MLRCAVILSNLYPFIAAFVWIGFIMTRMVAWKSR